MRHYSLSAAVLLAFAAGSLSGCATTGVGGFAASKAHKIEAQYDMARLAESEGHNDKAREVYEGIYKKDPQNAQVCHRLGIVHAKQSNYEAAKRYFNEAHTLRPSDPEILNDLGYTSYLSNDLAQAEEALGKAIKLDPRNHRATNNLALVVGTQGRLDESYRLFRMVNKEAEAHSNVAYLYAQQGQGKQALEHYSQALNIDPQMKNAGNAMIEIARLQQKMEADRSSDRTELANRYQPTPAVQQVSVATPAVAPAMPQLNDVIADARAAERAPAVEIVAERPARSVAAIEQQPATPVAAAPVIEETPAAPVETETEVAGTEENPFLPPTTPEIKPAAKPEVAVAVVSPVATAAKPVPAKANEFFEEVEERDVDEKDFEVATEKPVAQPVITPAPRVQPLANVADNVNTSELKTPEITTVDYVALCPQAGDKVKLLLVNMNSNDVSQIKPALHKLGELADEGTGSEPAIRAALKHTDSYVRIHAALALWRIKQNTEETLPVFLEGLQSTDAGVRSFAATALAMGPQTDSVIEPLTAALTDSNPFVRLHAAETLYQYEGQEEAATQVIVAQLNDKEANVRWLATFILGEIHPESEVAVKALTDALKDSDNRIRAGAAFALGGFGAQASPALPELKKLTSDAQADVRKAAEEAVRDIEHSSVQASSK